MRKIWSEKEVSLLKSNWKDAEAESLTAMLQRSWKSIERKAEDLHLKRNTCGVRLAVASLPDWLIGEMLSDGHITPQGQYSHTSKHAEYGEFLKNKFSEMGLVCKTWPSITFDKRTGRSHSRILLKTHVYFKPSRSIWYPKGKKIVPKGISFSDEMFLHLVMGDGSVNKTFSISTMGFEAESVRVLQKMLYVYGIDSTITAAGILYIKKTERSKARLRLFAKKASTPFCYTYKIDMLRKWVSA